MVQRRKSEWWLVVALLFALLPEGIAISVSGRTPVVSLFDLAILIVLVYLLLKVLFGTFSFDLSDKPIVFLSVAYIFGLVISLLANLQDVPRGFYAIKVFSFAFVTYLVSISSLRSRSDARRVLYGLIFWGAVVALMLAYNFATDWTAVIGQEAHYELKDVIDIPLGRSNYLAAMLVPILPLAVAVLLSRSGMLRIALILITALIMLGLLITMSKGAFAALLAGSLCAGPLLHKAGVKMRHVAVVCGVTLGLLLLMPGNLLVFNYEMILYRLDNPDFGRLEVWQVAWKAFLDHPLLGVGPNSIYVYQQRILDDSLYTHNFVLNTLAELGLVGSVPFFFLLWVLVRRSYRLCQSPQIDPSSGHVALGMFVGLISTLVHGLVEPAFQGQQYAVIFWTCMSLMYVHRRIAQGSVLSANEPFSPEPPRHLAPRALLRPKELERKSIA